LLKHIISFLLAGANEFFIFLMVNQGIHVIASLKNMIEPIKKKGLR